MGGGRAWRFDCTLWMMKISLKITKIIGSFRNVLRKMLNFAFLQMVKLLVLYKNTLTVYLGTRISSGNFSVSREHLKEKVLHALLSLRRHRNLSKLKTSLACTIFDTMISSILTYNSEIWVCMPNQILRPGRAHKSKRQNSSFANVT